MIEKFYYIYIQIMTNSEKFFIQTQNDIEKFQNEMPENMKKMFVWLFLTKYVNILLWQIVLLWPFNVNKNDVSIDYTNSCLYYIYFHTLTFYSEKLIN